MLLRELQYPHFPEIKFYTSQTLDAMPSAFVRRTTLLRSPKSVKFLGKNCGWELWHLFPQDDSLGWRRIHVAFYRFFAQDEYRRIFPKGTNLTPKSVPLNLALIFTGASHQGVFHHLQVITFLLGCNPICRFLVLFDYFCFTWLASTYPSQMK